MNEYAEYRRQILHKDTSSPVIALAGNPNTGKSTLFNAITGLRQHTGNWPGKTVLLAQGSYQYRGKKYVLFDLPGTYSLLANSSDEEITRDFICFLQPDVTVVVMDATCLERNFNLTLQIMEVTSKVVVCINLMDESQRRGIKINIDCLSSILQVPVIGTSIYQKEGLTKLLNTVELIASGDIICQPYQVRYDDEIEHAIAALEPLIHKLIGSYLPSRWMALRLLENPQQWLEYIHKYFLQMQT